jgi:hypothetical protein
MEATLQRLLRQSHLFDDPATYEAGVRDALEAVAEDQREAQPA